MNYLICIVFGVLPSLVWLGFYLRQDQKPEPKRMVIKVFILGMIIAIVTIFVQLGVKNLYNRINVNNSHFIFILYVFIGIGFIKEFFKYLAVRFSALRDPELDEPFDIIIYLIIAALGFVALENIRLFLTPLASLISPTIGEIAQMSFWRMITATFLHTLCSGILGSFLALSFYKTAQKTKMTILGLALASFLHGLYDFSIMDVEGALKVIIVVTLLISTSFLLWALILKIKKLPSVCK